MKICMMSSPFKDVVEEITFAGENGFQGVELAFEYPNASPEHILKKINQVRDRLSTYSMIRLGHAPAFINICDLYDDSRKASIHEMQKTVRAADKLDIRFLTLHPGFLTPMSVKDAAFEKTVKSLKELSMVADELNVTLGVENFFTVSDRSYFTRVEEFKQLFSRVNFDRLKFVLDVAHASLRETDSPMHFIEELYSWLKHLHLSDNLGEKDDHLPLGVGKVDYKTSVETLKRKGYRGTVTLEVFSRDRSYLLLSKKKVEELTVDS